MNNKSDSDEISQSQPAYSEFT